MRDLRRDERMLVSAPVAIGGAPLRQPWSLVPQRFLGFLEAITPSVAERQAAFAAARTVNGLLRRRFPDAHATFVPPVIGSHAKDTAVRGGDAVDVLFTLPGRVMPAALDGMAAVLAARFGAVEVGRPGTFAVDTTNGDGVRVRVRVLPVASAGDGAFRLIGADGPHASPHIDPRAELRALIAADRATGGKVRDLVRMLKIWRTAAAVPLASLAIDRFACAFLDVWLYRRRSVLFYDWMVRDCFFWMAAQSVSEFAVPGACRPLPIGGGWQAATQSAYALAVAACDRERDGDAAGALAAWRRIFGSRFGAPTVQPMAIASLPNGLSAAKAVNAAGT